MALDVGTKRIGVALAHEVARLPRPLTTLTVSEASIIEIAELVQQEGVRAVVVGLPRSIDGSSSEQTRYSEKFAQQLEAVVAVPIHLVDETLTSVQAEEMLGAGKHEKGEIDALAACFILQRFFEEHTEVAV